MQKRMSKVTEDRGTEQLSDGRKIPYSRRSYPSENYIVTTYGSHNAADHAKGVSLLVKHERRGKAGWGLVPNGLTMRRGAASSLLGDLWGKPETNELYLAVEHVRLSPETLKDTRTPYTAGSVIHDTILQAIKTGNTQKVYLLARCIEAVDKTFQEIQKTLPPTSSLVGLSARK